MFNWGLLKKVGARSWARSTIFPFLLTLISSPSVLQVLLDLRTPCLEDWTLALVRSGPRRVTDGHDLSGPKLNLCCNCVFFFTLTLNFPLYLPQKTIFVAFFAPLGSPNPRKTTKTLWFFTVFKKSTFTIQDPFWAPFWPCWELLGASGPPSGPKRVNLD